MDNVTNPPSNDSTVEEVNNVPLALLPLGVVFLVLGVSVNPGFYAPGLIFLLTSFALTSKRVWSGKEEVNTEDQENRDDGQDKDEGSHDESPEK